VRGTHQFQVIQEGEKPRAEAQRSVYRDELGNPCGGLAEGGM
jgi:hypothetical protein